MRSPFHLLGRPNHLPHVFGFGSAATLVVTWYLANRFSAYQPSTQTALVSMAFFALGMLSLKVCDSGRKLEGKRALLFWFAIDVLTLFLPVHAAAPMVGI